MSLYFPHVPKVASHTFLCLAISPGVIPLFDKPASPNSASSDTAATAVVLGANLLPTPAPSPAPTAMAPGPSPSGCPRITLILNSIEVYDDVIDRDESTISVQCRNKDGVIFPSIEFGTNTDIVRSAAGARYRPAEPIGEIGCGESVSCSVAYTDSPPNTTDATFVLLAEDGCWFDYRHFTQLSYQEPLSAWTCTKPPVRYTLECLECSDPNFPWDQALALSGPPLSDTQSGATASPTLNSVMVIISVSVVAGAVILVITALLMRTRRRNVEDTMRMTELMARARSEGMDRHRLRPSLKPPAVFVVGDPSDLPPPEGYNGPIVVLHCGEGEEEEIQEGDVVDHDERQGNIANHENLRWPQIAIARPEVMTNRRESIDAEATGDRSRSESSDSSVHVAREESNNSFGASTSSPTNPTRSYYNEMR